MGIMWAFTKKCWNIAKEAHPGCILDMPQKLASSGTISIFDLKGLSEGDGDPCGKLEYESVPGEKPYYSISCGGKREYVQIPRFGEMSFPMARHIDASKVLSVNDATEAISALAAANGVSDEPGLARWMLANGFGGEDHEAVMAKLGIRRVTAKQKLFEDMEKVRVNDPSSMEHGEGGRIQEHKKKDGEFVYLVLVDGSDRPEWFMERHLSKNTVGEIPYRATMPQVPDDEGE